jgi:serine/threonine protein phosphatase PrpC
MNMMNLIKNTNHQSCQMYGARHLGLQRSRNEDYFDMARVSLPLPDGATEIVEVAIVADGVGSHPGGKEASQIAVQTIRNAIEHAWTTDIVQLLESAIQQANTTLYHIANRLPELEKMATTVVVAAIWQGRLYVAHVGDSRAYLIRCGQTYQLTADHTWVQGAIQRGKITYADALTHEKRHVITRCLGVHRTVEVDLAIDNEQLSTTILTYTEGAKNASLALFAGDRVLLCTDGLFNTVQDTSIGVQVTRFNPKRAVVRLIALALAAGGPDNITVVALHYAPARQLTRSWGMALVAAVLVLGYLTLKHPPRFGLTAPGRQEPASSLLATQAVRSGSPPPALPTATVTTPTFYEILSARAAVEATPTRLPAFTLTVTRAILPTITPSPDLASVPLSASTLISSAAQVSLANSANVTYTTITTSTVTGITGTETIVPETTTITETIQPTVTTRPWFEIIKQIDGSMNRSDVEIAGNIPQLDADECLDLVWWREKDDQFRSFMSCQEIMALIKRKQIIPVNLGGQFLQGVKYYYTLVIYNQKERENSIRTMKRVSSDYNFLYDVSQ